MAGGTPPYARKSNRLRCLEMHMSCSIMYACVVLMVVTVGTAAKADAETSCPAGTRATPSGCVLDSELVLSEPLELPASTRLNCRGRRILPSSPGSGTTPASYVPSVPALAIAITGDRGIAVRNCVIGEED